MTTLDAAPTRPGLTARRIARTRADLAHAAAQLFKAQGYDTTTVEQICAAVDVSPRTFFRYFASKEDVLNELLESHLDAMTRELAARPASERALDSLVAAASCGGPDTSADFLELFTVVHRTPTLRARWLDRAHDVQARLSALLAERMPGNDPARAWLAAGAIAGTVTAVIEAWAEAPTDGPLRDRVAEALQLLADGFGLAGPSNDPGLPGRARES